MNYYENLGKKCESLFANEILDYSAFFKEWAFGVIFNNTSVSVTK